MSRYQIRSGRRTPGHRPKAKPSPRATLSGDFEIQSRVSGSRERVSVGAGARFEGLLSASGVQTGISLGGRAPAGTCLCRSGC